MVDFSSTFIKYSKIISNMLLKLTDLYKTNSYVRIITICSSSILSTFLAHKYALKLYWKINNLPPSYYIGLPGIGIATKLLNPNFFGEINSQQLMTTKMGNTTTVIICEPNAARNILSTKGITDVFDFGAGDLMFATANGEQWSIRRRYVSSNLMTILNSNFVENSTKKFVIHKLFPIFNNKANNNDDIKGEKYFRQFGFSIVLNACFGKELNGFNDPFFIKFDKLTKKLQSAQSKQLPIDIIFGYNNIWQNKICPIIFGEHWVKLLGKLTDLVDEYTNDKNNIIKRDNNVKLFVDFIKNYKNSKQYQEHNSLNITQKHLYGDMTIMIFAATDTSYAAMLSCCVAAAKYLDIQEKIYNELKSVFNTPNDFTLSNNNLSKLHLFRAFIHEILRVYTPAGIAAFRPINKNGITIKDGINNKVYNLPKKSAILLNIFGMNRNKNYWKLRNGNTLNNEDDIKNINLEFWLDNNNNFDKKRNGKSLFTFSFGKRDCVGQSLAMKQIYIVMGLLLLKYKFIPPTSNKEMNIKIKSGATGIILPYPSEFCVELR